MCDDNFKGFENYLYSNNDELNSFINSKLLKDDLFTKYGNFKWLDIGKVKEILDKTLDDNIFIIK